MRIVFDNNIWISFLIGKRLAALRQAFIRNDIEVYYCNELLDLKEYHQTKIIDFDTILGLLL